MPRSAGSFNSVKGLYTIMFKPPANGTYLAVLSLRHPNVNGSFRLRTFNVAALPAAPIAAAENNTDVVVFNPLVNPCIRFVATFPSLSSSYGARLVSDFSAIIATAGKLISPSWAEVQLLNSTPTVVNVTVST